ncbi:uncharacterized protein LOC134909835 [Pseudophryne corroboree]|uniref:uncharacterized protein LOC134909835 n=1 Tax=Pseudophryne corroboree TaxID=495146 RepID=UPI003081C7BD
MVQPFWMPVSAFRMLSGFRRLYYDCRYPSHPIQSLFLCHPSYPCQPILHFSFVLASHTTCFPTLNNSLILGNYPFPIHFSINPFSHPFQITSGFEASFGQYGPPLDPEMALRRVPKSGFRQDHNRVPKSGFRQVRNSFTDVFIGWPGRSHDARVLANSDLYRVAEDKQGGYLFPREKSKFVDGVEIPVHIIGDAAYPLRRWLMKGFTQHVQLSSNQITYTHTLSSARMVVENAFGRLKGRWRCLMKRNDVDINIMPNIVAACCILHNLCEFQREEFLPEWTVQASAAYPALDCEAYLGDHSGSAEQMRSAIMANLPSLLRSFFSVCIFSKLLLLQKINLFS